MNRDEFERLWQETIRSSKPSLEDFERVTAAARTLYTSDPRFRQHIQNRLRRIGERLATDLISADFDVPLARLLIADEAGYGNWEELRDAVQNRKDGDKPALFRYAVAAMVRGDFSAFESAIGDESFDATIKEWYERGYFDDERETLDEIFSAACMLGYDKTAAYLLGKGVDPYAGTRTGLSGFHYAASSGRLNVIKLLCARRVPTEVKNMYGGTVLGQALWSAVNEYRSDHAAIIETLIAAGAVIEPGSLEWWNDQDVPSAETKKRVAQALRNG